MLPLIALDTGENGGNNPTQPETLPVNNDTTQPVLLPSIGVTVTLGKEGFIPGSTEGRLQNFRLYAQLTLDEQEFGNYVLKRLGDDWKTVKGKLLAQIGSFFSHASTALGDELHRAMQASGIFQDRHLGTSWFVPWKYETRVEKVDYLFSPNILGCLKTGLQRSISLEHSSYWQKMYADVPDAHFQWEPAGDVVLVETAEDRLTNKMGKLYTNFVWVYYTTLNVTLQPPSSASPPSTLPPPAAPFSDQRPSLKRDRSSYGGNPDQKRR